MSHTHRTRDNHKNTSPQGHERSFHFYNQSKIVKGFVSVATGRYNGSDPELCTCVTIAFPTQDYCSLEVPKRASQSHLTAKLALRFDGNASQEKVK